MGEEKIEVRQTDAFVLSDGRVEQSEVLYEKERLKDGELVVNAEPNVANNSSDA